LLTRFYTELLLWPKRKIRYMKLRYAVLIIAAIIIADQALKIWIKTSFPIGHVKDVMGLSWFQLYFIENPGMAWGMELGGEWGKMLLTLFRMAAVIFGTWYLAKIVRKRYTRGFIICASLIYAGALGNLIDSMFYGMMFSESDRSTIATMFPPGGGYAGFLHGHVVDMLYFPIIDTTIGGKHVLFFSPIFNIADASISLGVIILLIFQKRFVRRYDEDPSPDQPVVTSTEVSDKAHVM
jgi:signal peptidase II